MSIVKKMVSKLTGYWIYQQKRLPIGADLFVDIFEKIGYPRLDVIFDVGANTGQTRRWLRHYLSDEHIYCFEPVTAAFERLKADATGDQHVTLVKKALGDHAGEKTIRLFEGDMTVLNSLNDIMMNQESSAKEETIRIDTVSAYCLSNNIRKIDLLKIDTEGFEMNVLQGAESMLDAASISFVYCEVGFQSFNSRNTSFTTVTGFLESKGYFFYGLYQLDDHDWARGNHLANALYVHKSCYKKQGN